MRQDRIIDDHGGIWDEHESEKAAGKCFKSWLESFGGAAGNREERELLAHVPCADPIPHLRLGRYVRFSFGSPELNQWWQRRQSNGARNGRNPFTTQNRS